jgi:DNA-binding PadR family transcriptional regulator
VVAEWGLSEKGKRAKFYRLSTAGRAQLRSRLREWQQYVLSVGKVLRPPEPA